VRNIAKVVLSVTLSAGAIGLAYVLLSPSIWSRETFEGFSTFAAIAIGSDLAFEISMTRSKAPARESFASWVMSMTIEAAMFAAVTVVLSVLLADSGPRENLTSGSQQVAFAIACLLVGTGGLWMWVQGRQMRRWLDLEQEDRLEVARAEARRSVADFVDSLDSKDRSDPDRPQPR